MVNPNSGDLAVKSDMAKTFEDTVYEGTVRVELRGAIKYCQDIVGDCNMEPVGITCPDAAARDIHELFERRPMPKQMAFSGTLWMLDFDHRVQSMDKHGFCEDAVGIGADGRETECEQGVGNVRGAFRINSR